MPNTMNKKQLDRALENVGFTENPDPNNTKKTWRYYNSESDEWLYVTQDKMRVVINPDHLPMLPSLKNIAGVTHAQTNEHPHFLHGASMKKFRERQNKGIKPIPHGIPFWFETRKSIELFFQTIFDRPVRKAETRNSTATDQSINPSSDIIDEINQAQSELNSLNSTEKSTVIKSRVGQGIFRELLLGYWSNRCAITDLSMPALLRASHIKPWRDSDNSDRLNVYNGLLLAPQYDLAFDKGYITFSDSKELIVSNKLTEIVATQLGISVERKLRYLEPDHLPFLQHHREHVFLG